MKVRAGFVSNSSSSSFCIYGVCFYDSTEAVGNMKEAVVQKILDENEYADADESGSICDHAEDVSHDVERHQPYDEANYWGMSFNEMKDDETKAEFRKRIVTELSKIFDSVKESDIIIYEEGWFDG